MSRLDRYVLRVFLLHWLVVAGAILGLFTVFNLIARADELGQAAAFEPHVTLLAARYYLANLPFLLVMFGPYLSLLAGLGTVLALMRGREWTPMLAAGRSSRRAFLPILAAALGLGMGLAALRETVLPRILVEREALERRLFDQRAWVLQDAWVRGQGLVALRAGLFLPGEGLGAGAATGPSRILGLELYQPGRPGGEAVPDRLILADAATWKGDGWDLENGRRISVDRGTEPVARVEAPEFGPRDLLRAWFGLTSPDLLALRDLEELHRRDPGHRRAATLIRARLAEPWVHLILLLLGLPFALRFERRSSLEGFAMGLLLSALYFVADFLLRDLGGRGVVSPLLGGQGAALLFGALALWAQERLAT